MLVHGLDRVSLPKGYDFTRASIPLVSVVPVEAINQVTVIFRSITSTTGSAGRGNLCYSRGSTLGLIRTIPGHVLNTHFNYLRHTTMTSIRV